MKAKLAEVVLHTGRLWLKVAGYYIVMQGTRCYDPDVKSERTINGNDVWESKGLHQVADAINKAAKK